MAAIKSPVCSKGHAFVERGGRQVCRVCELARVHKHRAKMRVEKIVQKDSE